jgi:large subunit ribosomal protein L22
VQLVRFNLTLKRRIFMAKGHRSQIKRVRNEENREKRPSAKVSYARMSVQKASIVLDAIRGKDVETALGILTYSPRYASSVIKKLLDSAIANAENNHGLRGVDLMVAAAYVDEGPTLKRFRPRAKGSASRINKRTSHITVVVAPRKEA